MKSSPGPTQEIDVLIRAGRGEEARSALRQVLRGKVPRPLLAEVAWLALRVDLPQEGILLLNSIVRPQGREPQAATEKEKAVYASCLGKIGAVEESLALLKGLDAKRLPEVFLFRGFAHASRWEFHEAIPAFRAYLAAPGLSRYDKLVGKTNLAGALVYEGKIRQATPLLRELLHDASASKLDSMLGKVFEISGECFVQARKWKDAEEFLRRSRELLGPTKGRDDYFVRKRSTCLALARSSPDEPDDRALAPLREEAVQRGYWESVRDCDRFEAIHRRDRALFLKVYFGTPYPYFRARLREQGHFGAIPASYKWVLAGQPDASQTYRLFEPASREKARGLKTGQLLHRLLVSFCSEFYRPLRVPTLFHHCYPAEFFNPLSSPKRVHEAIARLRAWFRECGLPIQVEEHGGLFRLAATSPCALVIPAAGLKVDRAGGLLLQLKSRWPEDWFTTQQAAEHLALSRRAVANFIARSISDGALLREGAGRLVHYRIADAGE